LAWKQDLIEGDLPGSKSGRAIYVLTPQGKVLELPTMSTPIDFAYLLHTDLGHRCRGAKIDGAMVPLNTRLRTGQTVEIIAARASEQLGPSRDWLNPSLGYLGSPRARTKVRQWFHALDEQRDLTIGRAKLEKLLQREGKTALALDELASRLGLDGVKPLFLSMAREEISNRAIENALRFGSDQGAEGQDAFVSAALIKQISFSPHLTGSSGRRLKAKASERESGVLVDGVASLLHHLAGCCRPIPPDDIAGFITRGEGVSVHRVSCSTYGRLLVRHPERAVQVSWGAGAGDPVNDVPEASHRRNPFEAAAFAAELLLRANDRPGLLRDLTELMSRLKIRMTSMRSYTKREQLSIRITVELSHQRELAFAIRKLRELPGVLLTTRMGD
jgi:GTP pyrophosphokinase